MKQPWFLCTALFIVLAACQNANRNALGTQGQAAAQSTAMLNQQIVNHEGETIMVGRIDRQGLQQPPFSEWFSSGYAQYRLDEASLDGLQTALNEIEILAFLGTWCSDSQYEIPHLFKILDHLGYNLKGLTLIALSNQPEFYKQSPQGEEQDWNIEYVPTVIFLKGGREIGRIVESPMESLEKDMVKILR
jgi:thiol-disulfide isomerase/thioredoxin